MNPLILVLTIVLIACSIALIAIILFQSGRNASVSDAVGGGLGGSAASRNKSAAKDLFLKRATLICSIIFVLIILVVNIVEVV